MTRSIPVTLLFSIVAGGLVSSAAAGERLSRESVAPASLVETLPSLAPFQHVRFCMRYPADCRSNPADDDRVDLTAENAELLDRVNRGVNAAIAPVQKSLHDAWMIAPLTGDCNDYAVTKRHQLLGSGLSGKALRLAVVKTRPGGGHLVLVVATTRGDLVLDNLTEEIRPWQSTSYQWMKIQSSSDARNWFEVRRIGDFRVAPRSKVARG